MKIMLSANPRPCVARLWIAASAVIAPMIAFAGPLSGLQLYHRMERARRHLNYQGTLVFIRGDYVSTLHIVAAAGGYERLHALTGTKREIIRAPHLVIRVRPHRRAQILNSDISGPGALLLPPQRPNETTILHRYYHFHVLGWDRVAGQLTRILAIVPRDSFRYGYRLWLDHGTDLPLRSELLGPHGRVLEQVLFTRIVTLNHQAAIEEIGPIAHWLKGESKHISKFQTMQRLPHDWRIKTLPNGFGLASIVRVRSRSGGPSTYHLLFTDGLASVSVFVVKHQRHSPTLRGATAMGSVHAFGRLAHAHAITAVGNVPASTVAKIAKAIVPVVANR